MSRFLGFKCSQTKDIQKGVVCDTHSPREHMEAGRTSQLPQLLAAMGARSPYWLLGLGQSGFKVRYQSFKPKIVSLLIW